MVKEKWMKCCRAVLLQTVVFGLLAFAGVQVASAHGYIESPSSRGLLCQQGANQDCGAIVWEPQSLEAPKGFPGQSVPDGQIASAGGLFPKLDEQSSTRWSKVPLTSGTHTFTWHLTAMHSTAKWHYYITKPDWNPDQPLTRDQFELIPFYERHDNGARPGEKVSHEVTIPERTGYHVILGVWDVADTANAFYNVIDVDFGPNDGTSPGEPSPPDPAPAYPEWNAGTVYLGGDRVTFEGRAYEARWWTQVDRPGTAEVWRPL
ncbi:lytic polysaccharide monooxygenase [Shouchella tritolerans]|uniref:lytic polysaccharide monooxygenase n=1 Tax=Shouchella tritolerans TaxID=2979466 RepID=UPI0021E97864|nr:lytic polysaccharide monooxygenase [Shouchella tritolerans]